MNQLRLKCLLAGATLLLLVPGVAAEPVVYTEEAAFLAELASLAGTTLHESFEDDVAWAESRNSIVSPGRTPSVTSQGIVWTSNYAENQLATGTVGGSAPDGSYAIYSLPHGLTTDSGLYCDSAEDPNIPPACFQNDGLQVEAASGAVLYAFGGRIDTANSGKVTFLLNGTDINGNQSDNIDNWQREGERADSWAFVGVIETAGFLTAELRELRGKDFQQVLLFADDFTIQASEVPPLPGDFDGDGDVDGFDLTDSALGWQARYGIDLGGDDFLVWQRHLDGLVAASSVPEPRGLSLLMSSLVLTMLVNGRAKRFFGVG